MHQTYRRLDEPPKLAGFSFVQWLALLTWGTVVYLLERWLGVSMQPAISAFTFLVGGPAALMYFSGSGRPSLVRLARDTVRWLTSPHRYAPGAGTGRTLRTRERRSVR